MEYSSVIYSDVEVSRVNGFRNRLEKLIEECSSKHHHLFAYSKVLKPMTAAREKKI